jgi:hypothetical protein
MGWFFHFHVHIDICIFFTLMSIQIFYQFNCTMSFVIVVCTLYTLDTILLQDI